MALNPAPSDAGYAGTDIPGQSEAGETLRISMWQWAIKYKFSQLAKQNRGPRWRPFGLELVPQRATWAQGPLLARIWLPKGPRGPLGLPLGSLSDEVSLIFFIKKLGWFLHTFCLPI